MKLKRIDIQYYKTPDGRYLVRREEAFSESCLRWLVYHRDYGYPLLEYGHQTKWEAVYWLENVWMKDEPDWCK